MYSKRLNQARLNPCMVCMTHRYQWLSDIPASDRRVLAAGKRSILELAHGRTVPIEPCRAEHGERAPSNRLAQHCARERVGDRARVCNQVAGNILPLVAHGVGGRG